MAGCGPAAGRACSATPGPGRWAVARASAIWWPMCSDRLRAGLAYWRICQQGAYKERSRGHLLLKCLSKVFNVKMAQLASPAAQRGWVSITARSQQPGQTGVDSQAAGCALLASAGVLKLELRNELALMKRRRYHSHQTIDNQNDFMRQRARRLHASSAPLAGLHLLIQHLHHSAPALPDQLCNRHIMIQYTSTRTKSL